MNTLKTTLAISAALLACGGRASAQWTQDAGVKAGELVLAAKALRAPRATMDGRAVKIVLEETATTPIVRLTGVLKLDMDQTVPCTGMMCTNFTVNRYSARLSSETGESYRFYLDLFELGDRVDDWGIVRTVDLSAQDGRESFHYDCPESDAPVIIACGQSALTLNRLLEEGLALDWTRTTGPAPSPRVEASFRLGAKP